MYDENLIDSSQDWRKKWSLPRGIENLYLSRPPGR